MCGEPLDQLLALAFRFSQSATASTGWLGAAAGLIERNQSQQRKRCWGFIAAKLFTHLGWCGVGRFLLNAGHAPMERDGMRVACA
jgi:hypothetical protein